MAPPDIRRQWPQPLEAFEALMANPTPDAFDAYVAAHWIPATLPRQELDIALAAAARATLRWGPRPWTAGLIRRLDQLASEGAPVSAALRRGAQALADGQAEILARIAAY